MSPELQSEAERWRDADPDPATAAELSALLANDPAAVAALFSQRIGFGTAGLRAEMGPGPSRMNRLVVQQTTAGLMRWLPDGAKVVIGYDARHNSKAFALDVAGVVCGAGGRAELVSHPCPTPVLAHAVLDRRADAGVMITASHNPAKDNGYKLYLADGIQLVEPSDREIASAIDGREVPRCVDEGWYLLDDAVFDAHQRAAMAALVGTTYRQVGVLYSAMHGVAGEHLLATMVGAGFDQPAVVAAQFHPDPDFPTVAFPNPEEAGALDLAFAMAEDPEYAGTIDLILANDPDGDRLAVAVKDRGGQWRRLTGDQVGVLLAEHLLRHGEGADRLVVSSIVSSRQIDALAAGFGVESMQTLTGFKWVARPIVDRADLRYVLGYEEALGYCVGSKVRDKDGISAALVMAELVAEGLAKGETVWDRLDRIGQDHGVYLTAPINIIFDGPRGQSRRAEIMARVVASPPATLAGVVVAEVEDLARGAKLPPTSGIVWILADDSRVIVRPSGTEPKLKAYIEVREPVGPESDVRQATNRAEGRLAELVEAVRSVLE